MVRAAQHRRDRLHPGAVLLGCRSFTRERAAAPPDDRCSRSPKLSGNSLGRNPALADALRPIAERHGTSVAALAVARTLA
jgi:aryl-alcohol dehydrogenase-like predicted oxidoreductase